MKTMFLPVLVFTLSFPMLNWAASFDCAKAASATEKLICNEDYLAVQDELMASYYEKAIEISTDKDAIKKSQIEWLKKQRACTEEDCISQLYDTRLVELDRVLTTHLASKSSANSSAKYKATVAKHSLHPINPNYPVCNVLADYLNSKHYKPGDCTVGNYPLDSRLQSIKYKSVDVNKYRTQLVDDWVKKNPKISSAEAIQNGIIDAGNIHLWEINVDLDNDGKSDSLLVRRDISKDEFDSQGCTFLAGSTSLIFLENNKFIDKWGVVYGEPVVFNNKTYLVSQDGFLGYFLYEPYLYEPYKDATPSYKRFDLSPMCSISK